ncbi:hypothetical protein D3C85_1772920 [compost metagenome]
MFATVRLLKVVLAVPPILWALLLLKVTVPVPAVKAVLFTLLIQFPPMVRLKFAAFSIPAEMVRLLLSTIAEGKSRPALLLKVKF